MTLSKDNTQTPVTPATDEKINKILDFIDKGHFTFEATEATVLALIARIHASEPVWQDIATAPRDGTKIDVWAINHLAYNKPGLRIVNVHWGAVSNWLGREREDWVGASSDDIEPTHWMPLPFPPKPLSYEGEQS